MSIIEIGLGHIFLMLAVICLRRLDYCNLKTHSSKDYFQTKLKAELKIRVNEEINQLSHENRVGTAWAELESKVLSIEIESEE